MKLCLHCESDMLVKKNFFMFKIPAAILLLLVPYGFVICWLPFLIPPNYACKKCGREFRKVKEVDWQVYEKMKQEKEKGK
ncbi:hypothetical protein E1I69_17480 [Bacillus timonensis]|uniref:LITAF domain-containing protein n=1 Tax=Bacillus timonensis TaxID=1033734 RepID=A0A4S3PMT8_9BACI|nr:hypothetical protein [Bacillus timonensis]THE10738.1 hypothetical protein E1I69_17480 [Bacillus timonensis]